MRKIEELSEIQSRLLTIVSEIDRICEENGLTLYMSGGTLLGAVRHKGFIPWDDDIDMYLTRPDYDKFIEIMRERNKTDRYILYAHELQKEYIYPFAKYVDTKTRLKENWGSSGGDIGLYVDIFPIDGLGKSIDDARKQMKKVHRYTVLNFSRVVPRWRKSRSLFKNLAVVCCRVLADIIGSDRILKAMKKQLYKLSYGDSKYVGEFVDDIGEKRIMLKDEMYNGYVLLDFEGIKLKAPKNYDKFLTQFYGDYMTLPPKEKQKATHNYELYDLEEE